MAHVAAIAGSLRERSYNLALLRAMRAFVPEGSTLDVHTLHGVPVYDHDVEEEQGIPGAVQTLKQAVRGADGLLLASPEYNHSIPGPLKNAIDWMSRPPADIGEVFRGRPVGLVGATPGRGGTRFAQGAWLPVFQALGLRPWFDRALYLDGAGKAFDDDLALVDDKVRQLVHKYVQGFFAFCEAA